MLGRKSMSDTSNLYLNREGGDVVELPVKDSRRNCEKNRKESSLIPLAMEGGKGPFWKKLVS